MRRSVGILAFLLVVTTLPVFEAQQKSTVPRDLSDRLPSALDLLAAAVGDRVRLAGKERTVFGASLVDETGSGTELRVVLQLPDAVRLEGLRPRSSPVIFDGNQPALTRSRIEEQLLEIFSSDMTEGMFAAIRGGAAAELLGRRVAVGGERYDIFEVSAPVRSLNGSPERLKRYHFHSETGLLARTQYLDDAYSPPLNVETAFSNWLRQDGSAYPTRIERQENGRTVFSLTITSIAALPRQDPANLVESTLTGAQEE